MSIAEIANRLFINATRSGAVDPALRAARDAAFDKDLAAAGKDAYVRSSAYTSIQRHGSYFDTNFDHNVSLSETKQGLRDLGLSNGASDALTPVINLGLGPLTHGTPNETLGQKLKNLFTINLDTLTGKLPQGGNGAFDAAGNFDPAKFSHMMSFDRTGKSSSLSLDELYSMVDADAQDKSGKFRTKLGFTQLMAFADTQKTETVKGVSQTVPALSRTRLQSFYDGTLFYRVAAEHGHPHALVPPKS
ncbi:MAG TPA: caleosin family protein [Oscillatoriaceae cyanobacterium]